MVTYAELEAEPWWGREIETPAMDWLGDALCAHYGRPADAFGTKGDRFHLRGSHRSQEWILNSRYCTSRLYTVQSGLTSTQLRWISGADITPGAWGTDVNRTRMIALSRRVIDAMKTGRLPEMLEFFGTLDGVTVAGWSNRTNAPATADDSHLEHGHLGIDRQLCDRLDVMQKIFAVITGGDDDMTPEQAAQLAELHKIATVGERTGAPNSTPKHPNQTAGGGVPVLWWPRQFHETDAALAGLTTKVDALTELLRLTLDSGPADVDTAAVLHRIDELAAAESQRALDARQQIDALAAQVTQLATERDTLRERLAAAARAEADALAAEPSTAP